MPRPDMPVIVAHGAPEHIRSDNGPEFIAKGLREWLERSSVGPLYIEPGSPWENGYAESFIRGFGTSSWAAMCLSRWRPRRDWARPGVASTTKCDLTVRWGIGPRRSSRERVFLPFRLRLRLSLHSRNTRSPYRPDSHYNWY